MGGNGTNSYRYIYRVYWSNRDECLLSVGLFLTNSVCSVAVVGLSRQTFIIVMAVVVKSDVTLLLNHRRSEGTKKKKEKRTPNRHSNANRTVTTTCRHHPTYIPYTVQYTSWFDTSRPYFLSILFVPDYPSVLSYCIQCLFDKSDIFPFFSNFL